jgi:hypothetical protein
MTDKKVSFRKSNSLPSGTKQNYGKYGIYEKQEDGKWKRLKKGYPAFRKTLDYKLMKSFLLEQGECESFLDNNGIKTLRSMIKSKDIEEEYSNWLEEQQSGQKI